MGGPVSLAPRGPAQAGDAWMRHDALPRRA